MFFEAFILNGYGYFVWPAFIFTFVSCFFLFVQANREYKKLEKIYLKEFNATQKIEIVVYKEKKSLTASTL
tara:strand:- start:3272 stop:3484 length:213 start_codon:yes stop_codon:yes gene_type:complete